MLNPAPVQLIEPETDRLRLRQWVQADRVPFAALIQEQGWGFWAVELKASREFIGCVGLHTPSSKLPFAPCVEIDCRLAIAQWGRHWQ